MPFVDVDGERLFFEDSGGPGPAVVLLHGFLLDRTSWAPVVAALAADYRCIAIDTRGHGMSSATRAFTCWDTSDDVVAVLDHLGIAKATVVGLSMGGWTALRATLAHPSRVDALCLVSTSVLPFEQIAKDGCRAMRDGWVSGGPLGEVLEGNLYSQFGPGNDDAKASWIARWQARTPAEWSNPWSAVLERLDEPDITARLAGVSYPVGFVHGSDDLAFPVEAAYTGSKYFSDSRGVTVVEGAPHASVVTHPDQVAAGIRKFLDGVHKT